MNWDALTQKVTEIVNALEPLVEEGVAVIAPEIGAAVSLGEKIIHGLINAEPTAVALVQLIKGGGTPTPEQLQKFSEEYESSYQKLKQDIQDKLNAI